jgi:uncharacterized membrane protein YdbT with pleckstrin-like domain
LRVNQAIEFRRDHKMETLHIKPGTSYVRKLWVTYTIIGVITALFGLLLGLVVGIEEGPEETFIITFIFSLFAVLFWIPAMVLSWYYYRSLSYEIQDDEVIVRVGIFTKSVKHVPYRTVTNVSIKRGILDRFLFDIGTLNIQTAGMSGTTGAEQSLVGLEDVQSVYEDIVTKLRAFRGAMSPTTADEESTGDLSRADVMHSMLDELKAIRRSIDKQAPQG